MRFPKGYSVKRFFGIVIWNYDREESKKKIMELKTKYPFRYSNGIKATMKYVVLMHFEWAFTLYSKVRKMRKGLSGG